MAVSYLVGIVVAVALVQLALEKWPSAQWARRWKDVLEWVMENIRLP